ncbi:MAG TPA: tRNA lysidine(34) synthetase TilS [Gemmatimonadales bacterium]|nr:tRNA lysidine(34) synthetase TilS [Gemmatimonadales bacterium]
MSLRDAFRAHLGALPLPSRHVLVAVSGGPDSIALLDLLASCRDALALELAVGHVDHGIHPDSARVASEVRDLAARYGSPFFLRRLGLGPGTSETTARVARYAALEALRVEAGAALIALAHHADDQAETVLMRVLRGSGPAGLAGMTALDGVLFRPLLPFRRDDLARHVRQLGVTPWDDPANRDPRYLRSWIRAQLLPLARARVPDVDGRLLRVAAQARLDREGWDALLGALPELDLRVEAGAVSVAAAALGRYHSKLALCMVMALGRQLGWPLGPTRAERVLALLRDGESGARVPLGEGRIAELAFGRLRLARETGPAPEAWEVRGDRGERRWGSWRFSWARGPAPHTQARTGRTAWFTPVPLVVRARRAGEKLRPLGGRGRRLLVRCFQEAHVPRSLRATWPVLEHAGAVVWLPGVCRSDLLVPEPGAEALRVDAEPV